MKEKQQYITKQENKETASNQEFYALSESGFGGQKYRLVKRYLKRARAVEMSRQIGQEDGAFITQITYQTDLGSLCQTTARKGSTKFKFASFRPTDKGNFNQYLSSRDPIEGKVSLSDLSPIVVSPVEYAIFRLTQKINAETANLSLPERIRRLLDSTSFFPTQNPDEAVRRLEKRLAAGEPFRIGCFACLNMKCYKYNDQPVYFVGQEENRLETPRISKRTLEIIRLLNQAELSFTWDFLLADTDAKDIYGDWLGEQNLADEIEKYRLRLTKGFVGISPNLSVILWSSIQAPYQREYQQNFGLVTKNCDELLGSEYVEASSNRRLQYFFKQVGLSNSGEIIEICQKTARKNIALYAAQGPIINKTYDLLVIAEPNPTKYGRMQSLLSPSLPIWYPYPG